MADPINIPSAGNGGGNSVGDPARNARMTAWAQALGIPFDEVVQLSQDGLDDSDFDDLVRSKDYPESWKAGQTSWNRLRARQNVRGAIATAKGVTPEQVAAAKAAQPQTPRSRMQELYDRLSKPANASTDPVLAGLQQLGVGQAGRASRGFRSDVGAGAQMATAAARNMSLPYLSAREGMATNLLGQMDQSDLNWEQVNQAQARMDNELSMGKFQMDANTNAAIGGGIGSVLGGIGGAIASIPSFGTLAPALIPAGIAAGGGIGAGVGQASSRRPSFGNYGRGNRYPGSGF